MKYFSFYQKLNHLLFYLDAGFVGTADELAAKLNISRRTLFRYFDELRDMGAQISYSKENSKFYLKKDFKFFESFKKSAF